MKSGYTNGTDAYNSGAAASGVQSVSSGDGIQVNNTDPLNPIVSANLTAGAGIQINAIPETGALEIECTVSPGSTVENVLHGVAKKTDGLAVDIAGIQNLVSVDSSVSIGNNTFVVEFTGTGGGNINIEVLHSEFVDNWGINSGIPVIVINKGSSACDVIDYDGATYNQINGADALTVRPGEMAMIWSKTATTWTAKIITAVRTISGGNGITVSMVGLDTAEISATGVFEADFGTETLPLAACRNATGIPNINNGGGALLATYKVVPASFMARNLQIFVKQSGGGSCTLALYSEAGALLAYTAGFTPSTTGKVTRPLAFDGAGAALTELELTGGDGYYFVLFGTSAANGAQFYGTDVGLTFGPTPYLGWTRDNITAVPATISGGSESSQRFYVLATA